MKKTEIFFPFEPVPKGRPKFTRTGHAYTPEKTKKYEKVIREYYQENTSDYYDTAIQISLIFYMPIPKSTTKKQRLLIESGYVKFTKKPDLDNMIKAVTDAILGVAYEDDSLITKINAEKRYTASTSGTMMVITEDVD